MKKFIQNQLFLSFTAQELNYKCPMLSVILNETGILVQTCYTLHIQKIYCLNWIFKICTLVNKYINHIFRICVIITYN